MLFDMFERFEHKKSLGQHFLNSEYVPKLMCDAAELQPGDVVVEIGPGTGALTKEILARGTQVIAIEADLRAIASLEKTCSEAITEGKLHIVHRDARKLDLASLGVAAGKYKVVANIPYYISGLLFRTFLDSNCQPATLVFLVQKELAERIARDPKESLLSLSVKVFGDVRYVSTIKRSHFTPPPKVDSAIVAVTNISSNYFSELSKSHFFTVIKAGFAQKRKQLAPNLKLLYSPSAVKETLNNLDLPAESRAEDISLSQWSKLITQLESTK